MGRTGYNRPEDVVRVEAREWLQKGNEIDFTNNPHFVGSKFIVAELYELGAKKVEVLVTKGEKSTRTLIVTLPEDRDVTINVLVNMLELEIEAPEREGNEVYMYLNWDINH